MTIRTSGFIRLVMGLLVGLALMTSCGGDSAPEAEVGQVQLNLETTSAEGVVFRLRNALFEIRGPGSQDIDSEDYLPDEPIIMVQLQSGAYAVELVGQWYIEHSADFRPFTPIAAALVSANPVIINIVTAQVTSAIFSFEVAESHIDFGPGTLGIGVDVTILSNVECIVNEDCPPIHACIHNICMPPP